MTTYVLGAGASVHAGYPLGSQLWARLALWIIETFDSDHPYRKKLDLIVLEPLDQGYLDYPAVPPIDPEFKGGGCDNDIALILPILEKRFKVETTFGPEWEPFWNGLWERAAYALAQSSTIVVIG